MTYYLSYLLAADRITDKELTDLGIIIEEKRNEGDRTLRITEDRLPEYIELVKAKLTPGFWNEIVGEKEIIFIFKFKDGCIRQYSLSHKNEDEIAELCSQFNEEPIADTENVYKFLSEVSFYHDFMIRYYSHMINRRK